MLNRGIRVNGMVQGAARTAIITKNPESEVENYNEERITAIFPMYLVANPSEITWLLSDEPSFATGYILSISRGITRRNKKMVSVSVALIVIFVTINKIITSAIIPDLVCFYFVDMVFDNFFFARSA